MNIIIINHYAGGPKLGMEFRPFYLAKQWQASGNKVMIIAGSYSHLRSRNPLFDGATFPEEIDGVQYVWLKTNSYKGNGLGRVRSMFLFVWRLFTNVTKIIKNFNPDLIIASSTYPLDVFPCVWLSRRFKATSCYEVHDLWPLSPIELGGISRHHPFMMLLQYAENYGYRKTDYVVSMLPNALEHMISHGLQPSRYVHVPNGISIDDWSDGCHPERHIKALDDLKKDGKVIVGYAGGHAIANALDVFIDVASLCEKEGYSMFAFLLIGEGEEKTRLIEKADALKLTNVLFLPSVPKGCVPKILTMMDVLYLGSLDNPLYRFGISPNKLFDYMMAAKPIVHSVNAANDIVGECGCGIRVTPGQPREILKALIKIEALSMFEKEQMGNKGKEYVLKNHEYTILAKRFLELPIQMNLKKH